MPGYYYDAKVLPEIAPILGTDVEFLTSLRVKSLADFTAEDAGMVRKVARVNSVLAVNLVIFLVEGGVPLREAVNHLSVIKGN